METKLEGIRFTRVDSDVIDKLIAKEETVESKLSSEETEDLTVVFQSQLPADATYLVSFEAMKETANPTLITQNEFMRRMKDMSKLGGEMSFYGNMPDSYNLIINANHSLILKLNEKLQKASKTDLTKFTEERNAVNSEIDALNTLQKDKKEEEIPQEEKDKREELNKKLQEIEDKRREVLTKFGNKQKKVKQLIDLALLSNNMLKGKPLSKFVKRSIELIDK